MNVDSIIMKNLLYYPLQKKHYGRYTLNKMTYTTKTYSTRKLFEAYKELKKFRSFSVSPLHERFIFPYICGTYFGYRKVDVLRVAARSEEHSLNSSHSQISYAVFCLKKKK